MKNNLNIVIVIPTESGPLFAAASTSNGYFTREYPNALVFNNRREAKKFAMGRYKGFQLWNNYGLDNAEQLG